MLTSIDGLLWLSICLAVLLYLQRTLHREMQVVLLLTTRHTGITLLIFSLVFLPGVFLHELSHFVFARLLFLRTGRFSIMPDPLPDGRLQMGYVEVEHGDVVRGSLVGAAPIILGTLFVAWVATQQWPLPFLWDLLRNGHWSLFSRGLTVLTSLPDFWLWFYLTFVVSSTMLPSDSDRYAWLPMLGLVGILFLLALLSGAGPWMLDHLAPPLNLFLRGTALVMLVSVVVHAMLIPPFWAMHRLLSKITGLDVV